MSEGDNRSYGLQDWRQSRLSEPRRRGSRANQLRSSQRQDRTLLHDSHHLQRLARDGSIIKCARGWPQIGNTFQRHDEGTGFSRKGKTQLAPRLETSLQGELRAHAHGFSPRGGRSPQEPRLPQSQQAPLLPRKENARTCQVSLGERNGDGAQLDGGNR